MKLIAGTIIAGALFASAAYGVGCSDGSCKLAMLRDSDAETMRFAQATSGDGGGYRRPELRDERHEALFFRGGYSFAASGQGLADGAGAPLYAVGYRTRIREGLPLSFEAEVVFQRDKDPVIIGVGQEEATRRAISGLASLRYDAPKFGPVTPYFSGGFGPVHVKTEIDNGFTPIADSKIELGYGARVGVAMPLTRRASVEAGYRLLGATNDAIKTHSAEIGLSFSF